MPPKSEPSEDVYDAVWRDPCDMVKAELLESEFPIGVGWLSLVQRLKPVSKYASV